MTPAARVQAAIEILDQVLDGAPAERALTGWARRSRFAGSKDRAAVRDHVFDAIRCKRSYAALGGALSGRGLMLGALRAAAEAPEDTFTGVGHAPAVLDPAEQAAGAPAREAAERLDIPDWIWPLFTSSLAEQAEAVARALQSRAPVHLRVNRARNTRDAAILALARDGITAEPHPAAATALTVTDGSRKIRNSQAYLRGMVELQDAASQAVVETINLPPGTTVLDYCAGGGGKSLALAAHADVQVTAHDADPGRMTDLPDRAARAGVFVPTLLTEALENKQFDVVLVDAPCSGSGAWRRSPDAKWRLTPGRLDAFCALQADILARALHHVAPGGTLVYATCSLLREENQRQVEQFLQAHAGWRRSLERVWLPPQGTDGFFAAHLTR